MNSACKPIYRDFPVLTDTDSDPGQHRGAEWYRIMQNDCDGTPATTNIKQMIPDAFTIYKIDGKGATACGDKVLAPYSAEIKKAAVIAMKRYAQAARHRSDLPSWKRE